MGKLKVLFVAANPAGTTDLNLGEEVRLVGIKVRASERRDSMELVPRFAARPDDLLQSLLEVNPHVVHFAGHGRGTAEAVPQGDTRDLGGLPGDEEGIVLQDNNGRAKVVSK